MVETPADSLMINFIKGAKYPDSEVTYMTNLKDRMVQLIQRNAAKNTADLASELVRAKPEEKEQILAGIDFERWLQQCCQECLN